MDDPFDKSSSMPFILGGKCTACFKSVCIAMKCSVFYTKRFCTQCAENQIDAFPKEIVKEISTK